MSEPVTISRTASSNHVNFFLYLKLQANVNERLSKNFKIRLYAYVFENNIWW